jgi:hypothetical protein
MKSLCSDQCESGGKRRFIPLAKTRAAMVKRGSSMKLKPSSSEVIKDLASSRSFWSAPQASSR